MLLAIDIGNTNIVLGGIDKEKIQMIKVDYDEDFIKNEYLPKLEILTNCLKEGVYPW